MLGIGIGIVYIMGIAAVAAAEVAVDEYVEKHNLRWTKRGKRTRKLVTALSLTVVTMFVVALVKVSVM